MLVKELIYTCIDLSKEISDDAILNEDHIVFLCKKYRSFLLKKEQEKNKTSENTAPESEYQQICLNLEKVPAIDGEPCTGGYYLRTTDKIPTLLDTAQPRIYPSDYLQGTHISYISRDRMRYIGSNPYLKNITFVSLGPDYRLYLNSSNTQFLHLKQIRMNAVFEDFEEAAKMHCDDDCNCTPCDVLDMEFPMREYLVPTLIELVLKEILGVKYQPRDLQNDAADLKVKGE